MQLAHMWEHLGLVLERIKMHRLAISIPELGALVPAWGASPSS